MRRWLIDFGALVLFLLLSLLEQLISMFRFLLLPPRGLDGKTSFKLGGSIQVVNRWTIPPAIPVPLKSPVINPAFAVGNPDAKTSAT